jgi:hypothetical protein
VCPPTPSYAAVRHHTQLSGGARSLSRRQAALMQCALLLGRDAGHTAALPPSYHTCLLLAAVMSHDTHTRAHATQTRHGSSGGSGSIIRSSSSCNYCTTHPHHQVRTGRHSYSSDHRHQPTKQPTLTHMMLCTPLLTPHGTLWPRSSTSSSSSYNATSVLHLCVTRWFVFFWGGVLVKREVPCRRRSSSAKGRRGQGATT